MAELTQDQEIGRVFHGDCLGDKENILILFKKVVDKKILL